MSYTTHVFKPGEFVGVIKGKEIRLAGTKDRYGKDGKEQIAYDRVFKVGDWVEYDSYNLSYIGTIASIGAKTVTIAPHGEANSKKRRLKLYEFSWRNWNFDLEETQSRNSETMMSI